MIIHGLFIEIFGEILHAITWDIYRDFRGRYYMLLHGLFMEETFGEILHAITWAIYGGDFQGDITCNYMGYL